MGRVRGRAGHADVSAEEAAIHLTDPPPMGSLDGGYLDDD